MKRLGMLICILTVLSMMASCTNVDQVVGEYKAINDKMLTAVDTAAAEIESAKTADEIVAAIEKLTPAIEAFKNELKAFMVKNKNLTGNSDRQAEYYAKIDKVNEENGAHGEKFGEVIKKKMQDPAIAADSAKIVDAFNKWVGVMNEAGKAMNEGSK